MAKGLEYALVNGAVRKYKAFEGWIVEQMQYLLGEGRDIIAPNEVVQQRLYGFDDDKQLLSQYTHTHLAVVPHPSEGGLKFVHKHPIIYRLKPSTKLYTGALPVSHEMYEQKEGLVLTATEVQAFWNDPYALPQKREEVWEFFTEGNIEIIHAYKQGVCQTLGLSFDNVMGLNLPKTKGLRLVSIGEVDGFGRSDANGDGSLGGRYGGRLVGVVPEAQPVAKKPSLEAQIQ